MFAREGGIKGGEGERAEGYAAVDRSGRDDVGRKHLFSREEQRRRETEGCEREGRQRPREVLEEVVAGGGWVGSRVRVRACM